MAHFVPAVACCSLCPGWARPGRPGRWAGAAAPVQHQELVPGSVRSPGPLQCPAPARAALRHTRIAMPRASASVARLLVLLLAVDSASAQHGWFPTLHGKMPY